MTGQTSPAWMERCGVAPSDWAIVTGASSGLGSVYARKLAEAGLNIAMVALRRERMEALKPELAEAGVESLIVPQDLSKPDAAARIGDAISDRPVGMIVNNAGFGLYSYFHDCDIVQIRAMIDVHASASTDLTHRYLPGMIARNRGAVINVSSIAAFTPSERNVTYTATKAYLNGFTEALGMELARLAPGVCVQALCPGPIRTEFYDLAEYDKFDTNTIPTFLWMTPEEVVGISLDRLGKGAVIVPGLKTKLLARALRLSGLRQLLTK